jgi:hypothetical protein
MNTNKNNPQGLARNSTDLDADALLQASRRLDWRFLFPNPELGQVACLGAVPANLLDSLRLFSKSLTILAMDAEQDVEPGQYDVIVARQLSIDKLHLAAERLKPGGYLYAEIDGLLSSSGQHRGFRHFVRTWNNWRLATPAGCISAVTHAGFTEAQGHWHWPNFAACTKIIPLDDRGALRFSFVRGGRSAKAKVQSGLGRWLLWSGLLIHTVPRFSVVAQFNNR